MRNKYQACSHSNTCSLRNEETFPPKNSYSLDNWSNKKTAVWAWLKWELLRIQKLVHNHLFLQQPARPWLRLRCCAVLRAHGKHQTRPTSGDSELIHSLARGKPGVLVRQQDSEEQLWAVRGQRAWAGLHDTGSTGPGLPLVPRADLTDSRESPAPQGDANRAEIEAVLCQEFASCHRPAHPQAAVEDKILPSCHKEETERPYCNPCKTCYSWSNKLLTNFHEVKNC